LIANLALALALIALPGAAPPAQPPLGKLPGSTAMIVANLAGRPVQFVTYASSSSAKWAWYPAKRKFVRTGGTVSVSSDERWEAMVPDLALDVPTATFTDRKTGARREIELPVPRDVEHDGRYLQTIWPTWSPDGRHLLLNVFEAGGAPRSAGIVLVDVPSLESRFVPIANALITVGGFQWTHDSKGVVVRVGKNGRSSIRQYDLTGAVKRTWHVRGRPASSALGTFSPSGRRFVTACTYLEKAACVWDTATGRSVTRFPIAFSARWANVLGWYDEQHLLAATQDGMGVVDLTGKVVETLIKADPRQNFFVRFDRRG
jgi:hypothetical protein